MQPPPLYIQFGMAFNLVLNSHYTYLSRVVNLTNYEVAVVDLYIPLDAVVRGHRFVVRAVQGDTEIEQCVEPFSTWSSFEFVKSLSDALSGYATLALNSDGKLHVECISGAVLYFSKGLSVVLGLVATVITGSMTASRPVLIGYARDRVSAVCNVIPPYYVNGRYLSCIYNGPPTYHNAVSVYHPTLGAEHQVLKLSFYNVAGEELDISDASFTCQLRFRPRS